MDVPDVFRFPSEEELAYSKGGAAKEEEEGGRLELAGFAPGSPIFEEEDDGKGGTSSASTLSPVCGYAVLPPVASDEADMCVYCGVTVDKQVRWDLQVCRMCTEALQHSPRGSKRHGQQFAPQQGQTADPATAMTSQCAGCGDPVAEPHLRALDGAWHRRCFTCHHCAAPLESCGYIAHLDHAYCELDYFKLFGPRCAGCHDPIRSDYVDALGASWHIDCFTCADCHCPLLTTAHWSRGKLYCERDHYRRFRALCHLCNDPIKGLALATKEGSHKFHPAHFACAHCLSPLSNDHAFTIVDSKFRCHTCSDP